jgi:hypothetical protein
MSPVVEGSVYRINKLAGCGSKPGDHSNKRDHGKQVRALLCLPTGIVQVSEMADPASKFHIHESCLDRE